MSRLRTVVFATAIVAGALTSAPPATASHGPIGTLCGLTAVQNSVVTGQGTMEGHASAGPLVFTGGSGSARCVVKVNGSVRSATAWGSGTFVVLTADRVTYVASDTSDVRICTQYTDSHGAGEICDAVVTIELPDGSGRRSHNGKAHHGGHKKNGDPPPPTPNPYRPRGTIEMTSTAGIVNISFTNFDPPFATWNCPPATGASVTCTPPPPPPGYTHNLCDNVTVSTNSVVPGTAYGTSGCASPPHATASSTGPSNNPSQASAAPSTSFPWTCAAATVQTVVWTVRCGVGP